MSYGFTVYTDRASIATTKVYSETSGKTYSYSYGTGQQSLNGFTDGDYLNFTAEPASGYTFKQWIYHIGSPSATAQYSTSNPFKYYGSTGNDIYIAAEGVSSGGTAKPSVSSCTCQTSGRNVTVKLVGTNLIGYTVTLGLSYTDGTSMTIKSKIPITSNTFSTTITAVSSATDKLSVVFDPGGTYAKTYYFDIELADEEEYFKWSSSVAKGLPIKNVSHDEWDSFIDKIIEVLTKKGILNQPIGQSKYGYSSGTTYNTMLQDCYMQYDTTLKGYPLTAQQFNIARFIIGSNVSTGISDKTSKTSKVIASEFITLANCLKTWQG